jgi:hypothetical protein
MAEDQMNAKIILALETAPRAGIPADFAARVAVNLPAREALVLTPGRYGRWAVVACLVMLPGLMMAFTPQAAGTSLYWFLTESILTAQSVLLALWLVARGNTPISTLWAD